MVHQFGSCFLNFPDNFWVNNPCGCCEVLQLGAVKCVVNNIAQILALKVTILKPDKCEVLKSVKWWDPCFGHLNGLSYQQLNVL